MASTQAKAHALISAALYWSQNKNTTRVIPLKNPKVLMTSVGHWPTAKPGCQRKRSQVAHDLCLKDQAFMAYRPTVLAEVCVCVCVCVLAFKVRERKNPSFYSNYTQCRVYLNRSKEKSLPDDSKDSLNFFCYSQERVGVRRCTYPTQLSCSGVTLLRA